MRRQTVARGLGGGVGLACSLILLFSQRTQALSKERVTARQGPVEAEQLTGLRAPGMDSASLPSFALTQHNESSGVSQEAEEGTLEHNLLKTRSSKTMSSRLWKVF